VRQDVKVTYFSDIIGRFDKQAGKIYGVSVITEGKAKGHELIVDSQTLMEIKNAAETQFEGKLKTKLNHRSGVEAVFGYLENFRVEGPKLLADLKMLKSHKDFEQTFEQIESLPNQIGLSVAFVGKEQHAVTGEKLARCREILSADLVPEPAANPTGMFEVKRDHNQLPLDDQKTHPVVDTEKINNMSESNKAADPAKEPTLADVMNFLQETVLPRLEAAEQFQSAIQAELEAAAAEDPNADPNADPNKVDPNKAADPANASAHAGAGVAGENRDGGTRAGAVSSPSNASPALATAGAGAPSEMQALRESVVNLERRIQAKDDEERETQLENALGVIKQKTEALTEYARGLETENATLLEALRTGAKPVKQSPSEIFLGGEKATDFPSRVKAYVDGGKSKTEAVMLARKDDPGSHATWLAAQGVVTHL
jgi:hypothetical protein